MKNYAFRKTLQTKSPPKRANKNIKMKPITTSQNQG